MHQNAYWRSGPIENNAISGVDEALWDIKGKMADMPLYELFGGKVRPAVPVFLDARGRDFEEMCAEFDRVRAAGCGAVRCACDSSFYSGMAIPAGTPEGALPGNYIDQRQIINGTLNMFEKLRVKYGEEVELMYDTHERIHPTQAREFCHRADQYHLYFLEDVVSPENLDWLPDIRSHCTTPLAHGELDVNVHDWRRPIIGRSIDFIRPHISDIGGLTGARRVAMFAEQYDVRTCWHCPGDITPIGSACNIHLDLATPTAASGSGQAPSLPMRCARVPAATSTACARYSPTSPSTATGMYMSATSPATVWTSTKRLPRNTPILTERLPGPSAGRRTERCTHPDSSKGILPLSLFVILGRKIIHV